VRKKSGGEKGNEETAQSLADEGNNHSVNIYHFQHHLMTHDGGEREERRTRRETDSIPPAYLHQTSEGEGGRGKEKRDLINPTSWRRFQDFFFHFGGKGKKKGEEKTNESPRRGRGLFLFFSAPLDGEEKKRKKEGKKGGGEKGEQYQSKTTHAGDILVSIFSSNLFLKGGRGGREGGGG